MTQETEPPQLDLMDKLFTCHSILKYTSKVYDFKGYEFKDHPPESKLKHRPKVGEGIFSEKNELPSVCCILTPISL